MLENATQIKCRITINGSNIMCAKKYYSTCTCENGKYLRSIIDNSAIACDEIIEVTEAFSTKIVPTKNNSINFYT